MRTTPVRQRPSRTSTRLDYTCTGRTTRKEKRKRCPQLERKGKGARSFLIGQQHRSVESQRRGEASRALTAHAMREQALRRRRVGQSYRNATAVGKNEKRKARSFQHRCK